jgi:hypothetical protein
MAQHNEVAYNELLDSAGHDQDGKADQPELPVQFSSVHISQKSRQAS